MKNTDNIDPADQKQEGDLTDSPRDQERLRPDTAIFDMPDVKDIPGQENVHVPPLGELADTTISSDDEEGKGILDDFDDDGEIISKEQPVSRNSIEK